MEKPKTTSVLLHASQALVALVGTIKSTTSGVFASFESPAGVRLDQVPSDSIYVRVDVEGAEGVHRIILKHDGTWHMASSVVVNPFED